MTSRGYPLYAGASLPRTKVATLGVREGRGRPSGTTGQFPSDGGWSEGLGEGWTFELCPAATL